MRKLFLGAPLVVLAAGTLTSCQTAGRAAAPLPESEQIISNRIKDLYMAASAAPQRSAEQRQVILRMVETSSNGKELLLTMRAGAEHDIEPAVTAKMMELATLDQLSDYAKQYSVSPERARPYVQRMFQLGESQTDPIVWQRTRAAAARLKLPDLERQAQDKADQLAAR